MFGAEIRKMIYTPVNPSFFTISKWGLRGSDLYRLVFVMETGALNVWAILAINGKQNRSRRLPNCCFKLQAKS